MMVDRSDTIRLDAPFAEQEAVRQLLRVRPGVNPKLGARELGQISREAISQELVDLGYSESDLLGIELEILQDGEPRDLYRWKADLGEGSSSGQQIVVSQQLETYLVDLLEKARLSIRDYGTNFGVHLNLLLNAQNPYSLRALCVPSCNENDYDYSHPHIYQDNRLVKCCNDPC